VNMNSYSNLLAAQPAAAARPGGVGRGRPSLANSFHQKPPLPRIKRGAGPHSRILRIGSPRSATITTQRTKSSGDAPRGEDHRCLSRPASQTSPLKEQNRVVMLCEGRRGAGPRFARAGATKTAQGEKASSFTTPASPASPASRGRARGQAWGQALAKAQRGNAEFRFLFSC
jgi:hypothetical protein